MVRSLPEPSYNWRPLFPTFKGWYSSWPSTSVVSESTDSTNHELKVLYKKKKKEILESLKKPQNFYLHSIYIVLGIIITQRWFKGFPSGVSGKESACPFRRCRRHEFDPWVWKISWRRKWQPTPVSWPGNPMDRVAWQATAHRVTKETRLSTTQQQSCIPVVDSFWYLAKLIQLGKG